jgi:Protein of unknown function (DUF3108)
LPRRRYLSTPAEWHSNREALAASEMVRVSADMLQFRHTLSRRAAPKGRAFRMIERAALRHLALRQWLLVGILAYALAAGQAMAGSDTPIELRYRFSWAGVPIAELGLRHAIDSTVYQTEIAIRTIGLADQLLGYRSASSATGKYEEPDGFTASRFRSASTSYRKSRRILVRFDHETGDVIELALTKRGEPDRSKVPEALQKGVMDPFTAVLQMRHLLAATGDLAGYTAAVFDGRRRFDAKARVTGRHETEIAGENLRVIEVEIGLTWIAGANEDDIDEAEAGDNQVRLKMLLSDDERLIPLQLSTTDSLLTATAEIMPECLGPAGCPPVSG